MEHESLYGNKCSTDHSVGSVGSLYSAPLPVEAVGGAVAMVLKLYDFPPYRAVVDARALWHATMIPLSYLWWSFVRDDSVHTTSVVIKKRK